MKIKCFIFASLILMIISKSFAGSCADGSDPLKSISADGTYYVYSCEEQAPSSQVSSSINTTLNLNIPPYRDQDQGLCSTF